jgi:hypothetical protein
MTDFIASIPHTFNIWVQKYKKRNEKTKKRGKNLSFLSGLLDSLYAKGCVTLRNPTKGEIPLK